MRSLACGLAHSAAIVGDGELWTWGCNHKGQCGHVVTGPGTGTVPPRVEEQEAANPGKQGHFLKSMFGFKSDA